MIAQGNKISLYGYEDKLVTLNSSFLTDESGNLIDSESINFKNITSLTNEPVDYSVSIISNPFMRGLFDGWMILKSSNNVTYIPLSVSSEAYLMTPILLVLTGVCLSVCLWEIIRFYKYKPDLDKKYDYTTENSNLINSMAKYDKKDNLDEDKRNELQNITTRYTDNEKRIRYYDSVTYNYFRRDQEFTKTTLSIGLIEFISAIFGMAIGLFVTFNDILSSSDLVIDPFRAIILFGIGLGAGSLKELVDK